MLPYMYCTRCSLYSIEVSCVNCIVKSEQVSLSNVQSPHVHCTNTVQVYTVQVHAVHVYTVHVYTVQVYSLQVYTVQVYSLQVYTVQVYPVQVYPVQVYRCTAAPPAHLVSPRPPIVRLTAGRVLAVTRVERVVPRPAEVTDVTLASNDEQQRITWSSAPFHWCRGTPGI